MCSMLSPQVGTKRARIITHGSLGQSVTAARNLSVWGGCGCNAGPFHRDQALVVMDPDHKLANVFGFPVKFIQEFKSLRHILS